MYEISTLSVAMEMLTFEVLARHAGGIVGAEHPISIILWDSICNIVPVR